MIILKLVMFACGAAMLLRTEWAQKKWKSLGIGWKVVIGFFGFLVLISALGGGGGGGGGGGTAGKSKEYQQGRMRGAEFANEVRQSGMDPKQLIMDEHLPGGKSDYAKGYNDALNYKPKK